MLSVWNCHTLRYPGSKRQTIMMPISEHAPKSELSDTAGGNEMGLPLWKAVR